MRISVNLASRPFVEMRPLFARLRLVMIGLALLAVALGFTLHSLAQKAATAQAKMNNLKAKTLQFQTERASNEARMRQPQNQAVLLRSQFLNGVFQAKSFSWTAVLMDLEKVLPVGVQVTSIEPVITKEGAVNIRLRVSGDRERAVQLVRNLETSQRFLSPRLASEQAQTQEGNRAVAQVTVPGAVQFDVISGYNPLPENKLNGSTLSKGSDGSSEDGASEDQKPAHPAKLKRQANGQAAGVPPAPTSALPKRGGVR